MKKIKRAKLTIITNFLLVIIICTVFTVGFSGERAVEINGENVLSAVYHGDEKGNKISISFNVYEGAENVKKIIKILKDSDSSATFFVGGCWADDNVETLKEIIDSGFEIGNHGYFHKDHKKLDYEGNFKEISSNAKLLNGTLGIDVKLFAPPSGSFNKDTLFSASALGERVIMWSKDTIDWRDSDKNVIYSRATKNLKGGDYILMHPKDHSVAVLPDIIKFAKEKGFRIVKISDNL